MTGLYSVHLKIFYVLFYLERGRVREEGSKELSEQ